MLELMIEVKRRAILTVTILYGFNSMFHNKWSKSLTSNTLYSRIIRPVCTVKAIQFRLKFSVHILKLIIIPPKAFESDALDLRKSSSKLRSQTKHASSTDNLHMVTYSYVFTVWIKPHLYSNTSKANFNELRM